MKRRIKRIVIGLLAFLFVLVPGIRALASGGKYYENFDSIPKLEDGTEYEKIIYDGLQQGALEARKEDVLNSFLYRNDAVEKGDFYKEFEGTRSGWVMLNNYSNMTYYGQTLPYTCGPACVRMTLKYLTGTVYTEDEIADDCQTDPSGTYLAYMINYMNAHQSVNTYLSVYQANQSTMKNSIYAGVATKSVPVIIGVNEYVSSYFPYNGNVGHYIVIYGIKDDKSEMVVADPWAGYNGQPGNAFYVVPDSDMYSAYSSLNIGLTY